MQINEVMKIINVELSENSTSCLRCESTKGLTVRKQNPASEKSARTISMLYYLMKPIPQSAEVSRNEGANHGLSNLFRKTM